MWEGPSNSPMSTKCHGAVAPFPPGMLSGQVAMVFKVFSNAPAGGGPEAPRIALRCKSSFASDRSSATIFCCARSVSFRAAISATIWWPSLPQGSAAGQTNRNEKVYTEILRRKRAGMQAIISERGAGHRSLWPAWPGTNADDKRRSSAALWQ